jgi:hypothetical protein
MRRSDGPEFQAFANPLAEMEQTNCGHCEEAYSLTEFYWEDTEEKIADYFERHRATVPEDVLDQTSHEQVMKYAVRGAIIGGLIAIAIGSLTGFATSLTAGIVTGVVLAQIAIPPFAILHFMKFEKKIVQPLMEKHLSVKDVGELR